MDYRKSVIIKRLLCCGVAGLIVWAASGLSCGTDMPMPGMPAGPIGSSFTTATKLILDDTGVALLESTLTASKVDAYDVGPVAPGDRVRVSLHAGGGGGTLRPVTAVFDADQNLFSYFSGQGAGTGMATVIDAVANTASSRLFLCLSNSAAGGAAQTYAGEVEVLRGGPPPNPPPQTLLLNFAGGTIVLPEGTFTVMPFDAADIDADYAGQTAEIRTVIVDTVKSNFRNTHVRVVSSDEPPPSAPFSTIEFGAFSATLFGISQDVDQENVDRCDDGIVFTNDFDKAFAAKPSTEGIATAIANVAAHEAGHLLGLNHTTDPSDLMDSTGSASTLLADQEFTTANLHPAIFPFGRQNGLALINRVVGPP